MKKKQYKTTSVYAVALHPSSIPELPTFICWDRSDNDARLYNVTHDFSHNVACATTMENLIGLLDRIKAHKVYTEDGENTLRGYSLVPVMVTIAVEDMTDEIGDMEIARKRAHALSKLSPEEKQILGLT